ncbi:MAG: EpsI family protein [Cycloclasticus sp.]|nr:EpsI family protein [Cycloclasticus sp.]
MVSLPKKSLLLLTCMLIATSLGLLMKPTLKMAEQGPRLDLETMIPKKFGDWHELTQKTAFIINPVQKEVLDNIYAQTLSKTYINSGGDIIMLSIAYGDDQSDAKRLHYPEVCYPAQGFQVLSTQNGMVNTAFGDIRVKRMLTVLGNRIEPLTYWTTVGSHVVLGGVETKLAQLGYGFKGQIPDGLIFRVSSITPKAEVGYEMQQSFIRQLFDSISADNRLKLAGLLKAN